MNAIYSISYDGLKCPRSGDNIYTFQAGRPGRRNVTCGYKVTVTKGSIDVRWIDDD